MDWKKQQQQKTFLSEKTETQKDKHGIYSHWWGHLANCESPKSPQY